MNKTEQYLIKRDNERFRKRFCKPKPQKEAHKPRKVYNSYSEYLKSDEWQTLRIRKLIQSESRCQICNSSDRLEVHHRTYENVFHERLIDLTVLCHRCHSLYEETRMENNLTDEQIEIRVMDMLKDQGWYKDIIK